MYKNVSQQLFPYNKLLVVIIAEGGNKLCLRHDPSIQVVVGNKFYLIGFTGSDFGFAGLLVNHRWS
jgi:hypothetical protein